MWQSVQDNWFLAVSFVGIIAYLERRFSRLESKFEDLEGFHKWKHDVVNPTLTIHEGRLSALEAVEGLRERRKS